MSNSQYINRYPYWEFVIFVPVLYCRAWVRSQSAHRRSEPEVTE